MTSIDEQAVFAKLEALKEIRLVPFFMWKSKTYSPERKNQYSRAKWKKLWLPVTLLMGECWEAPTYNYYESILNNLDWHCGITYYEKISPTDYKNIQSIKVGCDYSHLYDDGIHYSFDCLLYDVRSCIDTLYNVIPPTYFRC